MLEEEEDETSGDGCRWDCGEGEVWYVIDGGESVDGDGDDGFGLLPNEDSTETGSSSSSKQKVITFPSAPPVTISPSSLEIWS